MSNFQLLEVVNRGSETQAQVAENLNKLTRQDRGFKSTFWIYMCLFDTQSLADKCAPSTEILYC